MTKTFPIPMDAALLRLLEAEKRREDRIRLAIAKGKQSVLPTQTKSIKLSKFEHNTDRGPLVVFAEELAYPFGYFGNYQAVRKYHPGYDTTKDYSKSKNPKKAKSKTSKSGLMLNEKAESTANGLHEKSSLESHDLSELKLPKLKSGPIVAEDSSSKLEFSKNAELPKLPAQEYIDNFRRNAADFERSLVGIGRGLNKERRPSKVKPRDTMLPRIDERSSLAMNSDKLIAKEDMHFRLPRLGPLGQNCQKREDNYMHESSKKKRKTKNNGDTPKKHDSKRSLRHSERKLAAQNEQAKWCRMTMQSNAYI